MEREKHPFTLLDGTAVLVRPYSTDDLEALNRWVKKKYLENVREACIGLDEAEQLELRIAALDKAARLSFQYGDGREIMMDDIQGFAYLGYLLIENPGFSFDDYFHKLYPDGALSKDGLTNLITMMGVAYGETPDEVPNMDSAG